MTIQEFKAIIIFLRRNFFTGLTPGYLFGRYLQTMLSANVTLPPAFELLTLSEIFIIISEM